MKKFFAQELNNYAFEGFICRQENATAGILDFDSFLSTAALRWLDWIFWGWYLPRLNINHVGMSKDMEKRLSQLYYIKMKVSYDLGFIAFGVAMAT